MKIPNNLYENDTSIVGNFRPQDNVTTGPVDLTVDNKTSNFMTTTKSEDIFKAFIPWFLYKPPYGFPRETNPLTLRQFAKNAYIMSVIKTLQDLVSSVPYEIRLKDEYIEEGAVEDKIVKRQIMKFFDNPNGNEESFEYLLRCWVKDTCEIGNFIGVKVFNKAGQFSQLFARDSATFLKNTNIYGYLGDRADFVPPVTQYVLSEGIPSNLQEQIRNVNSKEQAEKINQGIKNEQYDALYRDSAAYYQYGWTAGARPVPFGKREIIWGGLTPRTESIYEQSPIEILYDQILTLVYGSEYNLDFYLNNNLPTGIITLKGASVQEANTYRTQMENQFMIQDEFGNRKKKHFKVPISGYDAAFTQLQMTSKEMEVIEQQKWFTRLVWGVFGVTSDDMGIIEDSNKAISENQSNVTKRKAIKPFLRMFQYAINNQLMPEFGHPEYEFKFKDYDIDEDKQKHDLWEQEIRMKVRTPRQIATEELGISESDFDNAESQQMEREKQKNDMLNPQDDEWFTKSIESKSLNEIEKITNQMFKELEERIIKELNPTPLFEIKGYIDYKAIVDRDLDKYKQFFSGENYKQKLDDMAYQEFLKGVEVIEKKLNMNIVVSTQDLSNLTQFMENNIKDMNDELVNKLRQQIALGLINKEPMTKIKQRIKSVFQLEEARAKTILRTETNRLYGAGSFKAAEQSGVEFYKYVDAHLDARTSEICRDLQAKYGTPEQAIPLNEKFKLIDGREELYNPFHPNCRTVCHYIPKDEVISVDKQSFKKDR